MWPIAQAVGLEKSAALSELHAISGAENTFSFAEKTKMDNWKAFKDWPEDTTSCLSQLGTNVYHHFKKF